MSDDLFITLLMVAPFAGVSILGIFMLIYMSCRKPIDKDSYPRHHIDRDKSNRKLGGDSRGPRRPH